MGTSLTDSEVSLPSRRGASSGEVRSLWAGASPGEYGSPQGPLVSSPGETFGDVMGALSCGEASGVMPGELPWLPFSQEPGEVQVQPGAESLGEVSDGEA